MLTKESDKSDEKHVKNMVEKRSMLKQHNRRSCRLPLASFYLQSFFTPTIAALFEYCKIKALRKKDQCLRKEWWLSSNKSLNPTRANKAARAG